MAGVKKPYPWEIKVPGVPESTKPTTSFETMPQRYKPHWSVWKVEGSSFEISQKKLAKKGLSDPWARNDVWRCHRDKIRDKPPTVIFRGFRGGLVLFGVALWFHSMFGEKIVNSR